jgi:hypothetical protein
MTKGLPPALILLIVTQGDIRDEQPSPLLVHYDLLNMLRFLQKKILKDLTLDELEKLFNEQKDDLPIPEDEAKIQTILTTEQDLQEKVVQLIALYKKAHHYSSGRIIILIANLLFANKDYLSEYDEETLKLFPNQTLDKKFLDMRKSIICILSK